MCFWSFLHLVKMHHVLSVQPSCAQTLLPIEALHLMLAHIKEYTIGGREGIEPPLYHV